MATSLQRIGVGTLVPVLDPKTGSPAVDDHGTPLMRRWDETDQEFTARQELDRERERFARSRGTLVAR